MTNMIFAPGNTSIIEFGLKPHIDRSFAFMAAALGFDYWVLPQMATHLYLPYTATDDSIAALVRLVTHVLTNKGLAHLIQAYPPA